MSEKAQPSPFLFAFAIGLLNKVKAWGDGQPRSGFGTAGFPNTVRDEIDALLGAVELRQQDRQAPPLVPLHNPLDEPMLQKIFGDAIEAALAFGAQDTNQPPADHWLGRFWRIGRAERVTQTAEPLIVGFGTRTDAIIAAAWRRDHDALADALLLKEEGGR
jgi:hypothetical protein